MAADRAINMALRVLGIGEVERDFKRVGDAGGKAFADVRKGANGAALEVSEYTARLRRAVSEAKKLADHTPELSRNTPESRTNRSQFIKGAVSAEQERILGGLPDTIGKLQAGSSAGDAFGDSLGSVATRAAMLTSALGIVGLGIKASIDAFQEHERALDAFHAELTLAGNASTATAGDIEAMAERIVAATGQTERAALTAAQKLATIPGITKEGMEEALLVTAQLADALGKDLPDAIESYTLPVMKALAERDMKALIEATKDLDAVTRAQILTLADSGQTAEALKVHLDLLRKAAGDGPDGLTLATNRLSDAWDRVKRTFGGYFANQAAEELENLSWWAEKAGGVIDALALRWGVAKLAIQQGLGIDMGMGGPASAGGGMPSDFKPQGLAGGGAPASQDAQAAARAAIATVESKYSDKERTNAQAWADFKRELEKRGIVQAAGRTGFRSAADQNEIFRSQPGATPLDGYNRISRHQTHQALDPTRASFNANGAMEAAQAAGLKGFKIVSESGGRKHFEWSGHGKPGELDIAGSERAADAAARTAEQRERLAAQEQKRKEREAETARNAADQVMASNQDVVDSYGQRASDLEALVGLEGEALKEAQKRQEIEAAARRINLEAIDKEVEARRLAAAAAGKGFDEASARMEVTAAVQAQAAALKLNAERAWEAEEATAAWNRRNAEAKAVLEGLKTPIDQINDQIEQAIELLQNGALTADQFNERMRQLSFDMGDAKLAVDESRQAWVGFGDDVASTLADLAINGGSALDVLQQLIKMPLERLWQANFTNPLADWIDTQTGVNREANAAKELAGLPSADKVLGATAELGTLGVASTEASTSITAMSLAAQQATQAFSTMMANTAVSGAGGGGGLGDILSVGLSLAGAAMGAKTGNLDKSMLGGLGKNSPLGFASGTPGLPVGREFMVGENGVEKMLYHGGGRLEVIGGARTRREADSGGGGTVINQTYNVPARVDPGRTASAISRGTQSGMARAQRKGLAVTGRR